MSKKTQYPIYLKHSKWGYYCLLNKKESLQIGLYGYSTSIQYDSDNKGTWVHRDNWRAKCTEITKTEFKKAARTAKKILQEKLKT